MKNLIIVAIVVVLIGLGYFVTADHWWVKVPFAKVVYNGEYSPHSNVYRSRKGDLLINLESSGDRLYQVRYFPQGKIWFVGTTWGFYFLPSVALSKNVSAPSVDMGGPKDETKPELIVRERYLEFTTVKLARVRVEW